MNTLAEFLEYFTGGKISLALFMWIYFCGALGAVVSIYISVKMRDKYGRKKPVPFSMRFFLKDSAMRLTVLIMWLYIICRFSVPILQKLGFTADLEHERFYLSMVVVGFFSDRIPAFIVGQAKKVKFSSIPAFITSIKQLLTGK